ncbi:hypothetical protein KUTeg_000386 [Tegillarca granosa]|uniref:Uncharacterized protein n=1 Tax=Tegillarca granosa TaxID=220873 RepID=A0ABQ9G1T4_TEGGR|nr:hypothetical protein KUTeg_000386 [Tegillarca granosa]
MTGLIYMQVNMAFLLAHLLLSAINPSLVGFIGIITYGSSLPGLSMSVGWSLGLAILGLLLNITAGVFINIGIANAMEKRLPLRLPTIHPPRDPGLATRQLSFKR